MDRADIDRAGRPAADSGAEEPTGSNVVAFKEPGLPAPTLPEPHPDGIFFGEPSEDYHRSINLGSHSVVRLYTGGPYYWWESWMNPLRPEDRDTDALLWGRAFHTLILDGPDEFAKLFAPMPRLEDFPGALKTDEEIKTWFALKSLPTPGTKEDHLRRLLRFSIPHDPKAKAAVLADLIRKAGLPVGDGKEDRAALAKEIDPSVVTWDDVLAQAAHAGDGLPPRTLLKPDVWASIQLSAAMVTKNPSIARSFQGGYPEVSIYWREIVNGVEVPCKARIDYLALLETSDLKSIINTRLREFKRACTYAVSDYRYDIQAAHYYVARQKAREYARDGKVFGPEAKTPPRKWLAAFAKVPPQHEATPKQLADNFFWRWVWVFYQKTGAPIARGFEFSSLDGAFDVAMIARERALETYVAYLNRFGTEMWIEEAPIELIQGSDLPQSMAA